MAQYGRMDTAILGLPYGSDNSFEGIVTTENVSAGRPVYETPGTPGTVHATYVSGDVFIGIAVANQTSRVDSVGGYKQYEVVDILTRGKIYVQNAAAVSTAPATAYATSAGLFSPTASGNVDIGGLFRSNQATVSGLVLLEVNGVA